MLRFMLLIRKIRIHDGVPTPGVLAWLAVSYPAWWKGEIVEDSKQYTWEQLREFYEKKWGPDGADND